MQIVGRKTKQQKAKNQLRNGNTSHLFCLTCFSSLTNYNQNKLLSTLIWLLPVFSPRHKNDSLLGRHEWTLALRIKHRANDIRGSTEVHDSWGVNCFLEFSVSLYKWTSHRHFFFGTWYKVGYSSTYSTVQKFKKRHGLNLMCTELTVNKLASKGSRCCAQHNVLQLVHRTI